MIDNVSMTANEFNEIKYVDSQEQILSDFYDYLAEHFEIPLKAQTEIYKQMLIKDFIDK